MKLFHKIAVTSLGFVMAAAVGAGIFLHNHNDVRMANAAKGDEVTADVELDKGSSQTVDGNVEINWDFAGGKIQMSQLRSCSSTAGSGEQTFTAVNSTYISGPRMYRGHTMAFVATDEFMIKQVVFTYDGTYKGVGQIVGGTRAAASMTAPKSSKATAVTGAIKVTADTTNYDVAVDTSAKTITIDCLQTGGAAVVYMQNYDNDTSTSTTQIRPTKVTIKYVVGNEAKLPDTITISGESSLAVGESAQLSALATKGGSSTDVLQGVVWSSSNNNIASVTSTGVVTGLTAGSATIYAKSEGDDSIVGSHALTVTDGASATEPVTISMDLLGLNSNAYAANDGFHANRGFAVETSNVLYASDANSDGKKGCMQFRLNPVGFLRTRTEPAHNINKVIIYAISDEAPGLVVKGGSTYDDVSVSPAAPTNVGRMYTYAFSTGVKFVTVSAGEANAYAFSITYEFVSATESVNSLADFILGITAHRDDVIGTCEGATGNYATAKARYVAAPEGVRSAFQSSEDEQVAKARARYVQWAAVYGDTTPFALTMSSSNRINALNSNSTILVAMIIVVTLSISVGAYFIIRRRKEHN